MVAARFFEAKPNDLPAWQTECTEQRVETPKARGRARAAYADDLESALILKRAEPTQMARFSRKIKEEVPRKPPGKAEKLARLAKEGSL